ncbi:MAG: heparan-alpha-glucosaminide N-acetyltransferase domain-containing protein [Lishizhenia sp.]
MEQSENNISKKVKKRFGFIDAARSIAILLMLEGHFIGLTLDKTSFNTDSIIYSTWNFVRGFTAPMFFTVTGVIFVYLLCTAKTTHFFDNKRAKKGIRRALELLFWGYLLQFNIQHFDDYLNLEFNPWNSAFHVLQCIGLSILFIILIYFLHRLLKTLPLYIYYIAFGTAIFLIYPYFKTLPENTFFPANGPDFLQNMFKGTYSVFPIFPWVGFVLYGGAVGAILHKSYGKIKPVKLSNLLILAGFLLIYGAWKALNQIDLWFSSYLTNFAESAYLIGRFGQVLIVLALLVRLDKFFQNSNALFLKIGQNTLPIYVIHVMILYSGFFGIGLNKYLKNSLNPVEVIFGALCFIGFFVLFVFYLDKIKLLTSTLKQKIIARFKVKKS